MNWFIKRWKNEGSFRLLNLGILSVVVGSPFVAKWIDFKYWGYSEWDFTGSILFGSVYVLFLLIGYLKRNSE